MRSAIALLCGVVASCDRSGTLPPERPVASLVTSGTAAPPSTADPAPVAAPAAEPRSPAGLTARLADYDRLVAAGADAASIAAARQAVDRMAGQRDAHLSRLYWYTDLEEAKAEAKRSGRPILSLRLLGRLDEELSCANSRLFRIVLYSNENVSKFLRDTYVLHWSSERPAPLVTLDFGDGRVVKRTITGNSAHYVLDAQGRVVDALPGFYTPARFERTLRETIELAKSSSEASDDESDKMIAKHHLHMTWALLATWRKHLTKAYGEMYPNYIEQATLPVPAKFVWSDPLADSLPASAVNAITYSKADIEAPTLALLQPNVTVTADYGNWEKVAAAIPVEHIDANGRALIREKHPRDWSTRETAELDEAKLTKTLARFEKRFTEEAFRNEFSLHGAVHVRMSKAATKPDFAALNQFVYTRLFMTPKDDGWLGLSPADSLTGLPDDGIVANAK